MSSQETQEDGHGRIFYLRAECHYGPSVVDEWMAIDLLCQWMMTTAVTIPSSNG
jgi:hypothetical protein